MFKKMTALTLAAALVLSCLAGCGSSSSSDSSASGTDTAEDSGSTLVLGTTEASGGFDFNDEHNNSTMLNVMWAWDTLFELDPETNEVVGLMAKDWSWSDDNLELTITLKDNITALDGEKITADDVLYSIQRFQQSMIGSRLAAIDIDRSIEEMSDPETTTFTLYFDYEFGPGLRYLTYAYIYPKDWATEGDGTQDDSWWDAPDSTGPYTCVENVDGSHITFQLNDNYWNGADGLPETITVKYYTEQTALYIDYANGNIDAAFDLSSDDFDKLEAGEVENTTAVRGIKNDVEDIALNMNNEYLQDPNVRLAIAHALNTEALAEAAYGSLWQSAGSILSSNVAYYTDMGGYEYNVDLAKEYMAKSAYPDGFELHGMVTEESGNVELADMIQYYLSEIGINFTYETGDMMVIIEEQEAGNSDLSFKRTMWGNDCLEPDFMIDTLSYDGGNKSFCASEDPDDPINVALLEGKSHVTDAEREAAYQEVQQINYDEVYWIPVCELIYAYAYNNTVIANWNSLAPSLPNIRYIELAG